MKTFYNVLLNTLIANVTNSFLWFAVTFWAYLGTQSVIVTAVIGGSFMLASSLASLFFGNFVDHHRKKTSMLVSSLITLCMYALAALVFFSAKETTLLSLANPALWAFIAFILAGAVAGNMRMITLATLVTLLVPEPRRANANGMVGTVNGISFALTSVFSGLVIGYLGMSWAVGLSVGLTLLTTLHLFTITIKEKASIAKEHHTHKLTIRNTFRMVQSIPGLFGLILFTTFNNLLGGVFMALMDAYGLSLVSIQVWGVLWGVLSIGFIIGGLAIARFGLSGRPLKTLLFVNILMWLISIGFTFRSSIILTAIGLFLYMCLVPVVEAVEQTIVQKLVPAAKQGRVFGFAHSIEMAASPISAFIIGPLAELFFIPFMSTGKGVQWFGPIIGSGPERGIALVFICTGIIGLIVTLLALSSRSYQMLSRAYASGKTLDQK